MKLTNNRLYLDYNATAPLAESVLNWFTSGALPFGNPSSIHSSGKRSKKLINETTEYLKKYFGLKNHEIFYHSGATEGTNDIIKGFCLNSKDSGNPFHVVVLKTDHSCVVNQKDHVEALGGHFHKLDVNSCGELDKAMAIDLIAKLEGDVLFNYTLVNNETGVHLPLEDAVKIKESTGARVHVDGVQLIGKIDFNNDLDNSIDSYTFSGHKFGAMKGVGFSFVNMPLNWLKPLIRGGGQQGALRSGTENVHGIYSMLLALKENDENFDGSLLRKERDHFESLILDKYANNITIVSKEAKNRNYNTSYLIIENVKTDILITAFDMAQIDVSSGSACSSGAIEPSRVLLAQGYSEDQAKSSIRISFPSIIEVGFGQQVFEKFDRIISRFFK